MSKRVFLTESQFNMLMEHELIMESIFEVESLDEFKKELKKYARNLILAGVGLSVVFSIISKACNKADISTKDEEEIKTEVVKDNNNSNDNSEWQLAHDKVTGTVYNAIPAQCNAESNVTASNFRLNMYDVASHRIIAMERTFMEKLGLHYGDIVKVEGAGNLDGIWQIQDTMNKRFANQAKIDFLVPETRKGGIWKGSIKLYTLKNPEKAINYKSNMAPQISKKESLRQLKMKQKEWAEKEAKK